MVSKVVRKCQLARNRGVDDERAGRVEEESSSGKYAEEVKAFTYKQGKLEQTSLKRKRMHDEGPSVRGLSFEDSIASSGASKNVRQKRLHTGGYYDDLTCSHCGYGHSEEKMLICDKCDTGYHMFCLRPILVSVPVGDWFCPQCSTAVKVREFPLVQKKIVDFFRIEKPVQPYQGPKRRRPSLVHKKSRALLAHRPAPDVNTRLRQMASLATALTAVRAEFCNDLRYMPGGVPKSANCPAMELGGVQVMGKKDLATYDTCKAMWQRGEVPPLVVCYDPRQGFVVEADAMIADFTIIAEYAGEVDTMSRRYHDPCDAMMGLLLTGNMDTELVICPDRYANIARFLSGINNSTREGRKKINTRSVRFDIRGEVHTLLVAIRDIKRGERLYYDYNGLENEYPTHHFD